MTKQIRGFYLLVWSLVIVGSSASSVVSARAASGSEEQLLLMMRALEKRVEALEQKNSEYRKDAADARLEAKLANEKLKSVLTTPPSARNSYAMATEPRELSSGWSGAYFGASAGGARTRSNVTATEQYVSNFAGNPFPFNTNGSNLTDASGPGHRGGGMIDIFAGWNLQTSRVLLGGQLEATVADLNFDSAGMRTYRYFDASGPTGQIAVSDFRPQVSSRWMASALLRAGILVDDKTLLYGIGGWTLAQFQVRNFADNSFYQIDDSFVAGGWTAGAGLERKLDSNWSIRAEYRYTNFGNHSSGGQFNFQSVAPASGTQHYERQAQFDQTMQVGRIGIAYALGVPR